MTGGRGRVDIKVDVELNQSFGHLGRLGQMALDGESISSIVQAAKLTDAQREQALYAGQGTQAPPLPAANGPWSVMVPGTAYMRFVVHGGNLQADNVMQIRILPPRPSQASENNGSHLLFVGYEQSPRSATLNPSVVSLFNGTVNEGALSQCQTLSTNQQSCVAQNITMGGNTAYAIGNGAQAPIMTVSAPLPSEQSPTSRKLANVCVKKLLYQPTYLSATNSYGLCIYLAAIDADEGACSNETTAKIPDGEQALNWVQTFITDQISFSEGDNDFTREACKANVAHRDPCIQADPNIPGSGQFQGSPLYRPDFENAPFHAPDSRFQEWHDYYAAKGMSGIRLIFRDVPNRSFLSRSASWKFGTSADPDAENAVDNDLRLVSLPTEQEFIQYRPLIRIQYHFRIDMNSGTFVLSPLVIGGKQVVSGSLDTLLHIRSQAEHGQIPSACTVPEPPGTQTGVFLAGPQ